MTPPAATAAARDGRATRRPTRPAGPRRVSGPTRGPRDQRAVARTRLEAATAARPLGYARGHGAGTPALAGGAGILALPGRGIRSAVRTLPEAGSFSDRLLRSRAWIAVVAGLLIGLVFLQVSLLKINAGIGASVQKAASLEASNGALRDQINALSEDGRIVAKATRAGMVLPTPDAVRYLKKNAAGGVGGAAGTAVSAADAAAADAGSGDTSATDVTAAQDGSSDTAVTDGTDASSGGSSDVPADTSGDTAGDTSSDPSSDQASTDTAAADSGGSDTSSSDAATDSGGAVAPTG